MIATAQRGDANLLRARYLIPLVLFGLVVIALGIGLTLDPRLIPSPLIDKAVPKFTRPSLDDPTRIISDRDLKGRASVVNVWASWCVACRREHPLLMGLAGTSEVPIIGLNYMDEREDAIAWLERLGDPYAMTAADRDGRVGIEWGVYGVPETFVVDREGIIRHKHVGPIDAAALWNEIVPIVRELAFDES